MHFYTAEELQTAVELGHLVDALEAGHKRPRPDVSDNLIGPQQSRYLIRSAHDGERLVGSKLITIVPDNPKSRNMPAVQAVIALFDAENGKPFAVLDATELTYWKTAADSALASRFLSRTDATTLVVAGAGGLAPWLVRGHVTVRPGIERVLVWNRTGEKAQHIAETLRGEGIAAETALDLEHAVGRADIITTATMATDPILKGAWLKPGTHVDLVGGYSPDTREADGEVVRRGDLYVDSRESALDGVGDILRPIKDGVITESDIKGDLFDLVSAAAPARSDPDQITVFKNAGGAHLDLMVAAALVERLQERRK